MITDIFPYPEALREPQIYVAINNKRPPGDINQLLPGNFEEGGPKSAFVLQYLHRTLPQCWDFEPRRRPTMSTLLSHISDLSSWTVSGACREDDFNLNGSREGTTTFPEVSQNSSGRLTSHKEAAQSADWAGKSTSTTSENLLEREESGYVRPGADVDDVNDAKDDRRVRAEGEGSSDGWVGVEEDTEREEVSVLVRAVETKF